MTGRMPTLHGLRYNGCLLPRSANTFVDVLTKGGYHTAAIGKSHLQPFIDGDRQNPHADDSRLIDEAWREDPNDYSEEQPFQYADDDRYDFSTPYYGFQHVDMVTSHGDRCGGHYQQWFRENAPDWKALHDRANELSHNYSCPQAYRTPIPEELYPTSWIADRAADYINAQSGSDSPFFAFVSFPDPHHPFNPPGRYWDLYSPDQFDVDLPFEAHRNPTPPMTAAYVDWQSGAKPPTAQTAIYVSDQHLREAMALTAGMITCIDDAIGRVIEALKASGQFENTVICFNSDHGDYLGDFNMLLKGPMQFKSITRVPFIWSDPNSRAASTTNALASTIDVSATVLDRAGLMPYHGIQGESFLPTLTDGEDHRSEALIEYNDGMPRLGFSKSARIRTIQTADWRYTMYGGEDWGELYDLAGDPNETNNLWDDPAQAKTRAHFAERLNHHLTAQMDESPFAKKQA